MEVMRNEEPKGIPAEGSSVGDRTGHRPDFRRMYAGSQDIWRPAQEVRCRTGYGYVRQALGNGYASLQ